MQPFKPKAFLLSALTALSMPALAHSPYLLPGNFQTRSVLSVEAALTDNLFLPDVPYGNHQFSFTTPSGKTEKIPDTAVFSLPTRTIVEYKLTDPEAGTYRVTAGPRISKSRSWEIDGEVKRIRDPNEVMPKGAVLKSNTESHASLDVYITVGKAETPNIPKATDQGLEFVPITHPNQLTVGGVFAFVVQLNGKPLAEQDVSISYSTRDYSGESSRASVKTDASGKARYKLDKPGLYMASVRFNEEGAVSADKPNLSYSKTLTFNVTNPSEAKAEGQGRGGERNQGQGAGRGEGRGEEPRGQGREGGQRGEGRGEGRMQRQQ